MNVVDRYSALGIARPDAATVCKGHCEGTGWVPIKLSGHLFEQLSRADKKAFTDRWNAAHAKPHREKCDGWHFVQCPACDGTGKRVSDA